MKLAPRLVARTLMAIFLTVAVILTFYRLSVETRQRVRAGEIDRMETTARVFTQLEARRPASVALAELRLHIGTQFDPAVVDALHLAMPAAASAIELHLQVHPGAGA